MSFSLPLAIHVENPGCHFDGSQIADLFEVENTSRVFVESSTTWGMDEIDFIILQTTAAVKDSFFDVSPSFTQMIEGGKRRKCEWKWGQDVAC